MNTATETTNDTIDGQITEVKAPDNSLVVLNPEKYADELFAPFHVELTTAKRSAARKTYDIATKAGMDAAKELRSTFVKIRTRADKAKTEAKRPIDQAGKAILARFNTLKEAAEVEEAKHNTAIVAEEQRLADIEQKKRDDERARIEAIEARLAHIRAIPVQLVQADSGTVLAKIEDLVAKRLEPAMYEEFLEQAVTALNDTVDQLRELHTQAVAREAEAKRVAEERAELDRLRTENEAREKREAEERRQREADDKARADAAAAEAKAKDDELAQLRAQLAAMQVPKVEPVPDVVVEPEPAPKPEIVMPSSAVTIMTASPPCANFATPRKMARPSDADMVEVLAAHFQVSNDRVVEWLVDMNFAALTAAGA